MSLLSRKNRLQLMWMAVSEENPSTGQQKSASAFDITPEECGELFSHGFSSARKFLDTWNYDDLRKKMEG